METIAERTKKLIDLSGLNEYSFSKRIGKSPTAVTKTVKGDSKPGYDMLESIFREFPDLSREWYLEGVGEMWKKSTPVMLETQTEGYLQEHLKSLEENFRRLAAQLESKDKQIDGLQRTVDALLGNNQRAQSFSKPAPETGRTRPLYPEKKVA